MIGWIKEVASKCLIAGVDPTFIIKMKLNELVLREVAESIYPGGGDDIIIQNAVAESMVESSIHSKIEELAKAITDEVTRQSNHCGNVIA